MLVASFASLTGAKVTVAATAAVAAAVLPTVTMQQRSELAGPVLHQALQHVASVQAAVTASPPDIAANNGCCWWLWSY
jgi:hypothetical protein